MVAVEDGDNGTVGGGEDEYMWVVGLVYLVTRLYIQVVGLLYMNGGSGWG